MKEKWEICEPTYGCQIRVNRGAYYHFGIYIDDGHVVHFSGADGDMVTDPSAVSVIETSLDSFLRGGFLEVRVLTLAQKLQAFSPEKTVERARAALGEANYDFLKNNCEHFANYCLFGKRTSNQSQKLQKK